jgi:hypothetical protein
MGYDRQPMTLACQMHDPAVHDPIFHWSVAARPKSGFEEQTGVLRHGVEWGGNLLLVRKRHHWPKMLPPGRYGPRTPDVHPLALACVILTTPEDARV